MNEKSLKILFFGDIAGKAGRNAVKYYLSQNREKYDFIIANAENASHGFGLTQKNYEDLITSGIDCLTSGNHIWDKKEIFTYIEKAKKLIRPLNYPKGTAGRGYGIFDVGEYKICIMNFLGRVFMPPIDSQWDILKNKIDEIKSVTPNIFIDFHAEATAEKICFGKYAANLGITAFAGTHTHVQTADEQIVNDCMAYITDAGFCGAKNGVIGMEYETSLKRMTTNLPERFEVAQDTNVVVNAVEFTINPNIGRAVSINRINEIINLNNDETTDKLRDNIDA